MGDKEEVLEAVLKETVDLVTDLLKPILFLVSVMFVFLGEKRV